MLLYEAQVKAHQLPAGYHPDAINFINKLLKVSNYGVALWLNQHQQTIVGYFYQNAAAFINTLDFMQNPLTA